MSSVENEVIEILDMNPSDPELKSIIDDIADAYDTYLTVEDAGKQSYLEERIQQYIDRYESVAQLQKKKYEEMI